MFLFDAAYYDAYRRTPKTLLSRILMLVLILSPVGFSIAKAWLALLIFVLMFLSKSLVVKTLLPRYVSSSTSSSGDQYWIANWWCSYTGPESF